MVFCGRLLQNEHTLGEYNVQKPCVFTLVSGDTLSGRGIQSFIQLVSPSSEQHSVDPSSEILVQFTSALCDESHFHGMMLGGPDLATLSIDDIDLTCITTGRKHNGAMCVETSSRLVTFRPRGPLTEAAHYRLTVNARACEHHPSNSRQLGAAMSPPGQRGWHWPKGGSDLVHSKTIEEMVQGRFVGYALS